MPATLSWLVASAAMGLCAGTATGELGGSIPWLLAGAMVATAAALGLRRTPFGPWLWLAAIALAAAQLGEWQMQAAQAQLSRADAQVQRFAGVQQIRGLVTDEPIPRGRTTSLRLSDVLVRDGNDWQPLGGSLLVSVPHWPTHEYGEYLQLRGRLQPISGGGAVEALRRQGVMAAMSYPRVSYLANPQANPVLTVLARLRERLGAVIDQAVPEPAASELKATVLGIRGALPKDEQQALIDTGTVHLIVISGFKMTLIAAALQLAGAWILRRTTARLGARAVVTAIVVAAIAAYTLLSGATPSAVRAAIMAGTVALAPLMGRPRDQVSALALAVLAIVAPRPLELLDGGFQLSCLSVLGIALLAEPLGSRLRRVMQRGPAPIQLAGAALAEAVAASVAATVFILPVLAASFHVVSLISPLANLLGMPLLGPIMAFGGLGAALGAVWQPLGTLLLWPGWAFMTLLDWLIRWTAGLPNAALPVDALPPALVVSYYGLLSAATAWLRRRREDESPKPVRPSRAVRWAVLGGGAIAVASLSTWNSRAPATLRATLLAVPGQAALIQTPAGRTVLVDGGQNGGELLRRLGYLLPPWDRHLDLVLITSPRSDHIGGLDEVFARYGVGSLIEPDVERPSASFRRLQAGTRRAIADVVELGDGARLARDGETWRLEQGETSVVVSERGFAIRTPSGEFQVLPVRKGRGTASEADNVLDLSETGDVTVTFGSARPLD